VVARRAPHGRPPDIWARGRSTGKQVAYCSTCASFPPVRRRYERAWSGLRPRGHECAPPRGASEGYSPSLTVPPSGTSRTGSDVPARRRGTTRSTSRCASCRARRVRNSRRRGLRTLPGDSDTAPGRGARSWRVARHRPRDPSAGAPPPPALGMSGRLPRTDRHRRRTRGIRSPRRFRVWWLVPPAAACADTGRDPTPCRVARVASAVRIYARHPDLSPRLRAGGYGSGERLTPANARANSVGVRPARLLCGRVRPGAVVLAPPPLDQVLRVSQTREPLLARAAAGRHPSRKRPWKLSRNAFSTGRPGRMNSSLIPRR
jgi:hypothetical protein